MTISKSTKSSHQLCPQPGTAIRLSVYLLALDLVPVPQEVGRSYESVALTQYKLLENKFLYNLLFSNVTLTFRGTSRSLLLLLWYTAYGHPYAAVAAPIIPPTWRFRQPQCRPPLLMILWMPISPSILFPNPKHRLAKRRSQSSKNRLALGNCAYY